jgi:predicted metal-dependent phosphoesterase TrpH
MMRRFAVDFHVHTSYSFDSLTPPKVAIEVARRRGLDGIAVTDHDTVAGAIATAEANRYNDFLVIPGIEVKSDLGDIIGLFVVREVKSRAFGDVIAELHEQGAIAYLPHPIRTFGHEHVAGILSAYPEIDLWERYNGRYDDADFVCAEDAFTRLGIAGGLCGSDAHFPWEIGLFHTDLRELPRDAQTLLAHHVDARLHAPVRSDAPRLAGLRMGALIKMIKLRQYGRLAALPIRLSSRLLQSVRR